MEYFLCLITNSRKLNLEKTPHCISIILIQCWVQVLDSSQDRLIGTVSPFVARPSRIAEELHDNLLLNFTIFESVRVYGGILRMERVMSLQCVGLRGAPST